MTEKEKFDLAIEKTAYKINEVCNHCYEDKSECDNCWEKEYYNLVIKSLENQRKIVLWRK